MDQIEQMSPKRLRDEVLALFSEEHSTGAKLFVHYLIMLQKIAIH